MFKDWDQTLCNHLFCFGWPFYSSFTSLFESISIQPKLPTTNPNQIPTTAATTTTTTPTTTTTTPTTTTATTPTQDDTTMNDSNNNNSNSASHFNSLLECYLSCASTCEECKTRSSLLLPSSLDTNAKIFPYQVDWKWLLKAKKVLI